MLLDRATLEGIADGSITLAFRRWRRPTVRAGGTLTTAVGVLAIDEVSVVDPADITAADARAAGFPDVQALTRALAKGRGGATYRIAVRRTGDDPRIALRSTPPTRDDTQRIAARLARWDTASTTGPWTRRVLSLIDRHPGVRAADLARRAGLDRTRFKANVRKLKGLGLTESLDVGYRLSPRGEAFVRSTVRHGLTRRSSSRG